MKLSLLNNLQSKINIEKNDPAQQKWRIPILRGQAFFPCYQDLINQTQQDNIEIFSL